ncbi:MAG: hypothetical protein N2Z69_07700 [Methylophilaceae bacterium]|nr:hypothetical protein [Methylophilaceae bacterium]
MGVLKNLAKKALVAAALYAGRRMASKVVDKMIVAAKKTPPKAR